MHPDFDRAVAEIVKRVPNSYVVYVDGRSPKWTNITKDRLRYAMGETLFKSSVRFLNRTWYKGYLEYMSGVDIVLHPFPFGGSKTSIDALIVGV